MSPDHRAGEFFHSAYTAGGGVVCSGSALFADGLPKVLTNMSGHYKPLPDKLERVLRVFEMGGVPLNQLSILMVTPLDHGYFYGSVDDFRRGMRTDT